MGDRERDRGEFSAFVQRRQHRLLRAAYLIVGDERLAEDLLQNALIKLADRWPRVREGNPEAYLRTTLYRDAVSWWRRHRRERLVAAPPEPPAGADPADRVTLRLLFAQALAALTAKQRAVLVLRYFEDRSEREAAEILGVSVGTVKSQTSAALRRIVELSPDLAAAVGRD
ncbi:DNA-directed RNA polymerase sigma-70 factor [Actinocatenispora thailandica]|uniref:DNA-directed RNA polymerase sigma-70 factor n=1 Tax=Actinocatenispora thailandica TaxID=227318 RepID=A0A7R7HU88_9ACTN|nr:SigE family RNA polymerase sigma factor [Actinocatenispora thailandica]BCJ32542.1 DNA-directed RNA polymerase sigma-70 factor [Actinocatenispora thailandica]